MLSLLFSNPAALLATLLLCPLAIHLIHTLLLHPLARFPGPLLAKLTPLWLWWHSYLGTEPHALLALHKHYASPVIRIGPSSLSIDDPAAIHDIYIAKGGLPKPRYYTTFDIDGHASLFSTQDRAHRAPRARAVAPLFAPARIRASFATPSAPCTAQLDLFIDRLHRLRASTKPFDLVDATRRFALDALSAHLFGQPYGAQHEPGPPERASAAGFVDDFVSAGRLFLLPPWLASLADRLFPTAPATHAGSHAAVDAFTRDLAARAAADDDTYQSRMRHAAGASAHETSAQLKDLIFAGTDGVATVLTTILFHLVRRPALLRGLRDASADADDDGLLDATVKEGLRVALPNPARLPRVVQPGGLSVLGARVPAGTEVGCASGVLHRDERVFAEPGSFAPERWLDGTARMEAGLFAFGAGARQCIARNLAVEELRGAVAAVARSGVLEGCVACDEDIRLTGWFNARLEPVMVRWEGAGKGAGI